MNLEKELEDSKVKLVDSISRMLIMEEDFSTAHKTAELENIRLNDELNKLHETYDR